MTDRLEVLTDHDHGLAVRLTGTDRVADLVIIPADGLDQDLTARIVAAITAALDLHDSRIVSAPAPTPPEWTDAATAYASPPRSGPRPYKAGTLVRFRYGTSTFVITTVLRDRSGLGLHRYYGTLILAPDHGLAAAELTVGAYHDEVVLVPTPDQERTA